MTEKAASYDPPLPLEEISLAPGEWYLLTDNRLVAISGSSATAVIETAIAKELDLSASPVLRVPTLVDQQEHFF